ncbi:cytochrome P450 [Nocardiopsis ansamitocini]|uniref:Cytochrome P450 n=2 Tax=Nocardiopsis ansamitocini TaxID=1670832 RepID=A0A9W6P2V3_9ACTN|nr:cytochrome P450 [Nocardiopsis ansamitocini]
MAGKDFVKNYRNWKAWQDGEIAEDWPLIGMIHLDNMLHSDGDAHTRIRGLVAKAFTPRRVELLRPAIEELTENLLDQMERGNGAADLRSALAVPLPMGVICRLFGIPDEDRPTIQRLVSSVFSTVAPVEEVLATQATVTEYFTDLVQRRRATPGEDLTSALIQARDEGDQLSDRELIDSLWLFMAAGFETTVGVFTNAVKALLTHPDQLGLLRDGAVPWSAAVEETLRWDTSVAILPFRYPVRDVELGGRLLKRGDPVLVSFASANRDCAQHGAQAHVFDITREQKRHVAFGHGPHFCLGAPLARLELGVALPALFRRFGDLDLAVDPAELTPVPSIFTNAPERLPVRWNPDEDRLVPSSVRGATSAARRGGGE